MKIMDRKGFSPYETVIVICLIAVLVSVFYHYYNLLEKKSLYTTAKIDLQTIELNINLYKTLNGNYPDNMSVLMNKKYLLQRDSTLQTDFDKELASNIILARSKFKNGKLYDPFKNPYVYDNKTGNINFSKATQKIIRNIKNRFNNNKE